MLYHNTVNDVLKNSLEILMESDVFENFRLVGGTALSLQLGQRISVDIDLFSDLQYGSIDFEKIDLFLKSNFAYIDTFSELESAMGKLISSELTKKIWLNWIYITPILIYNLQK